MANLEILDLAAGPDLRDFHPHDLVLLPPALLHVALLGRFLGLVGFGADEAAEDLVGDLEGVIDPLVVDADGGVEEFGGELPEAKVGVFGEVRVDDLDWYLEGISCSYFLYSQTDTPFLKNSSRS